MNVTVDEAAKQRVLKVIKDLGFNARKEMSIAVNKASDKVKSAAAKAVSKELATLQRDIKKTIRIVKATELKLSSQVVIDKSDRIPLRAFKPEQVADGVTYRISRTKGKRKLIGAFMGPRPDRVNVRWKNNVFIRQGKKRLPINKLFGPSPWGVFVKGGMVVPTVAIGKEQLYAELLERVRFLTQKSKNQLKGKQR